MGTAQPAPACLTLPCACETRLTTAEHYAGELLAYVLQVVLGRAGDPAFRQKWASRGLKAELDLESIRNTLSDHSENELQLLVLDPNILPLMRVLYHYDPTLSLHQRSYTLTSVYPSPEVVAIRLLCLQKLARGERIDLCALLEREKLLQDRRIPAAEADLAAVGLTGGEMRLLREIVAQAPRLLAYLHCPFLTRAFHDIGLLAESDLVRSKCRTANYSGHACRPIGGSPFLADVHVAILTSMMSEYQVAGREFIPTEYLGGLIAKLRTDLLRTMRAQIARREGGLPAETPGAATGPPAPALPAVWEHALQERIAFLAADRRPFVIHPGNAREAVEGICPAADFTFILLDKNTYLSLHLDSERDVFPHVGWIYVDLLDVEYSQLQSELDGIARFLLAKLEQDSNLWAPPPGH